MKKKLLVFGFIVISFIWFFFFRGKPNSNGSIIKTTQVNFGKIRETVSSSGKTKATTQIDLKFQTSGRLAWIKVKEGDIVKKYQALAGLDVAELQKNLTKSLRDYSKTRNDFEEAHRDTYRDKPVTDTIKRILEKNDWDLDKSIIDVELKDIALKMATLTTPISGIVTHIDTPVAGVNILSTNIITIADPESLVFSANVDETDIGKIAEGMNTEVNLDAYPDKIFSGKVKKIAFVSETTSAGATVFPVEITLDEGNLLRLGLNGDVSIIVKEIAETLTLPNDAIKESAKTPGVYVIKKSGESYERITVKLGIEGETESEILEGLTEGDEIVIDGFQLLPKELQ